MATTTTTPNVTRNATEVPFVPFLNPVTKAKIGMAVGLLLTVFIVTMVPVLLMRYFARKWNLYAPENSASFNKFKLWMSRINCFAGGVFLSTGFMDIFPEMLEAIEEASKKNNFETHFPLGPFMTLVGFFLILIIEESVMALRKRCCSGPNKKRNSLDTDVNRDNLSYIVDDEESNVLPITRKENEDEAGHSHVRGHDHGIDADTLSKGNLAVTVLMVAISVHSIFEGLALGLEHDSSGASRLFLALCLHKYVIAITIGLQICRSTLSMTMTCVCAGIFSSATPIGVLLGFWVSYLEQLGISSFSVVSAVLQGMACGTFFYVVFFEILPEEFAKQEDKWQKILALILGFVLVSLVMYFVHE